MADFAGTYRVLDDQTHAERRRFQGPPVGRMCATSHGGRMMVQDRERNHAVVIDHATGRELARVGQEVKAVAALGESGNSLTAGDGFLRMYDERGTPGRFARVGDARSQIAVSGDGRHVAVTEGTGVVVCDATTLERVAFILVGHAVRSVQWGNSDEFLITSGLDSALWLWEWRAPRLRSAMVSPESQHSALCRPRDGRAWYSGSVVGNVRRWRSPLAEHATVEHFEPGSCEVSRDGRRIVAAHWKTNEVLVFDAATLTVTARHSSPVGPSSVVFGSTPALVYLAGRSGVCRLDLDTGQTAVVLESHATTRGVRAVASADGRAIAYAHDNGASIWVIDPADRIREFASTSPLGSPLAISADGRIIVSGWNNVANIINVDNGDVRSIHETNPEIIHRAALSPDGRFMATAAWNGPIHVRALSGDPILAKLEVFECALSLGFVDDERLVASDVGGHPRVLNTQTLEPTLTLHTGGSWLAHTIGPDGEILLTNLEGDIRRWPMSRD